MTQDEQVFQVTQDPDWINKSRVLIVTSRGTTVSQKKLITDIFNLLPHSKKEFKIEKDDISSQISELCQMHKCSSFMFFQTKKKVKFSLWIGSYPHGPSMKFNIVNIVSSYDLKLQGNSLKNSRHILSFDNNFDTNPIWKIAKQLFVQALNVPLYHPRSKTVIDHTLAFNIEPKSNSLWFKNYQIFREVVNKEVTKTELYQIGPRFVLEPVCILDGVLRGEVLYRNRLIVVLDKKKKKSNRKYPKEITELPNEFSEEQFSDQQ